MYEAVRMQFVQLVHAVGAGTLHPWQGPLFEGALVTSILQLSTVQNEMKLPVTRRVFAGRDI